METQRSKIELVTAGGCSDRAADLAATLARQILSDMGKPPINRPAEISSDWFSNPGSDDGDSLFICIRVCGENGHPAEASYDNVSEVV